MRWFPEAMHEGDAFHDGLGDVDLCSQVVNKLSMRLAHAGMSITLDNASMILRDKRYRRCAHNR